MGYITLVRINQQHGWTSFFLYIRVCNPAIIKVHTVALTVIVAQSVQKPIFGLAS